MDRLFEFGWNMATAGLIGIASGVGWLIRRVLTNQEEIALLRSNIEARDKLRDEDREAISDVRESVKRIEGWIMEKSK
jgi:hypothetical protein